MKCFKIDVVRYSDVVRISFDFGVLDDIEVIFFSFGHIHNVLSTRL
jgi:amino acid permease